MDGERVDAVEVDGDAVNVVPTRRLQRPNSASRDGWSVLDPSIPTPVDVSSGASHPTLIPRFPLCSDGKRSGQGRELGRCGTAIGRLRTSSWERRPSSPAHHVAS